jgi:hypothetical protein
MGFGLFWMGVGIGCFISGVWCDFGGFPKALALPALIGIVGGFILVFGVWTKALKGNP